MLVNCTTCGTEVNRLPNQVRKSKSGNIFCSRSCAVTFNNKGKQRNKPVERTCNKCSAAYFCKTGVHESDRLCQSCSEAYKNTGDRTVGFYRNKVSVAGKHPSWIHAHIRGLNRWSNRKMTELPCKNCGYDKHVELCHIKPVSSFGDEALVKEINSTDNVVQLCRNCHWEFDHGMLAAEQFLSS